VICRVLDVPRSSLYARGQRGDAGDKGAEQRVRAHIEQIAAQWPTYGYRRVTAQLHHEGETAINGKRVRRLMHELGVAGHLPPRRCRTTNSEHPYARYTNAI
jgi:putative transposase